MAVEDKFVDADIVANRRAAGHLQGSHPMGAISALVPVAAADDNGSVYRIGTVNSNDLVAFARYGNTAITAGTDYDIGLYEHGVGGAVVDVDVFVDGASMASATTGLATDGLTNVAVADSLKRIWELLGLAEDPQKQYDLAVTANVVGTAAGSIALRYFIVRDSL